MASKDTVRVNKNPAAPSSLKRKLDVKDGSAVKRSRSDKYNIESTLDPEADYDNTTTKQTKPQPSKTGEKAKPVKRTKAPTKQQSSAKSKAPTKKPPASKRKAPPQESGSSTEEQIEVNSTPIVKQLQSKANDAPTPVAKPQLSKANHAQKKAPKVSEPARSKSKEKSNNTTTPKSLQAIDSQQAQSLTALARNSLMAIGFASPQTAPNDPRLVGKRSRVEDSTLQNIDTSISVTPNGIKLVQPRAPVAQMSRAVIQHIEAEKAKEDRALQTTANTNQNIVSNQHQPSKPRQLEEMSQNDILLANPNIDPAILSEQYQASKRRQIEIMLQNDLLLANPDIDPAILSEQYQASKPRPPEKPSRNDALLANANIDPAILSEQYQTSEPQPSENAVQDASQQANVGTDAMSKQRQASKPRQIENLSQNDLLLANPNIDPAILSEQYQASEPQPSKKAVQDTSRKASVELGIISEQIQASDPQQIDDATQDRELQASATMDQGVLPEQHQASEPRQVENNRSKKPSAKPPKPSAEMVIEYEENYIEEVEERAFCNRGLDWNEILQSREALLESKIQICLPVGEKLVQYWVDKCPLSEKGKRTIKILGRDPKMARINSGGIVQNAEKYHTEPNHLPELVQADLYHLIIPRLIRYINKIYMESNSDADDLKMLDSVGILLKPLGELCDTAMHMEKHRDDHSGTELLGFEPKLNDALEQISDSSKRISERVDARRRFLLALQLKQRQDEANRREERQRAMRQREKEIKQRKEEIRQREEEVRQKQNARNRRERELQYQARLEAKQRANRERSELYWLHELPSSTLVLSEIYSIDETDGRVEQRKPTRKRLVSSSFVWTGALTDVLIDKLRKHQDLDIDRRYEQCLKSEQLKHMSLGEIRRRAVEVKPWLAEQWVKMKGSVPLYVWTIE